jgi:hypothetical protein
MHILLGAFIGMVVSVALTYVASRVIDRPLTWKDITASAVAGIIGGGIATATLGVGAATTLRTVTAFAAGGATGSASGQVADNVLHGHSVGKGVVKATAFGTVIGAGTLGAGKALAPLARHGAKLVGVGRAGTSVAATSGGHSNAFAGAAAGLDDAIVPVWRYVKKALAEDPEGTRESHDTAEGEAQSDATQSDATQSDATQSDATQSDATQSDATQSDATQSDATQSDATQSDATQSDENAAELEAERQQHPRANAKRGALGALQGL